MGSCGTSENKQKTTRANMPPTFQNKNKTNEINSSNQNKEKELNPTEIKMEIKNNDDNNNSNNLKDNEQNNILRNKNENNNLNQGILNENNSTQNDFTPKEIDQVFETNNDMNNNNFNKNNINENYINENIYNYNVDNKNDNNINDNNILINEKDINNNNNNDYIRNNINHNNIEYTNLNNIENNLNQNDLNQNNIISEEKNTLNIQKNYYLICPLCKMRIPHIINIEEHDNDIKIHYKCICDNIENEASINEMISDNKPSNLCPNHNLYLDLFCETCQINICSNCPNHNEHKIKDNEYISFEELNNIQENLMLKNKEFEKIR